MLHYLLFITVVHVNGERRTSATCPAGSGPGSRGTRRRSQEVRFDAPTTSEVLLWLDRPRWPGAERLRGLLTPAGPRRAAGRCAASSHARAGRGAPRLERGLPGLGALRSEE